jgi:hypothetical protein
LILLGFFASYADTKREVVQLDLTSGFCPRKRFGEGRGSSVDPPIFALVIETANEGRFDAAYSNAKLSKYL